MNDNAEQNIPPHLEVDPIIAEHFIKKLAERGEALLSDGKNITERIHEADNEPWEQITMTFGGKREFQLSYDEGFLGTGMRKSPIQENICVDYSDPEVIAPAALADLSYFSRDNSEYSQMLDFTPDFEISIDRVLADETLQERTKGKLGNDSSNVEARTFYALSKSGRCEKFLMVPIGYDQGFQVVSSKPYYRYSIVKGNIQPGDFEMMGAIISVLEKEMTRVKENNEDPISIDEI